MAQAKSEKDREGAVSGNVGFVGGVSSFLHDVRAETQKVTWPQQKEAVAGTIGVLVIVAVISVVLGLVDFGLAHLVERVLP